VVVFQTGWWHGRPAGEDFLITACKFLGYLILDQILPAANLRKQQSIYAPLSGAESEVYDKTFGLTSFLKKIR